MTTQLEINRKKAIDILLKKANNQTPIPFDYLLDDYLRELLNLPARPDGQSPYVGWMIGQKEFEDPDNTISWSGVDFIKNWEGCKLRAYLCSANVWTIGVGHTQGVTPGMTITQSEANKLFLKDINLFEQAVSKSVKVSLNQNQFDALVSFCFNVGVGAFKGSTLLRVLNQGNYTEAANQLLRWNKVGVNIVPGLVNRRRAEKELFLS